MIYNERAVSAAMARIYNAEDGHQNQSTVTSTSDLVNDSSEFEVFLNQMNSVKNSPYKIIPEDFSIDEKSCKSILLAAAAVKQKETVFIFGASSYLNIPLKSLCEMFENVVLIDLDFDSIKKAKDSIPSYASKISLFKMDLTGFFDKFLTDYISKNGEDYQNFFDALTEFVENPKFEFNFNELDLNPDFIVSTEVLSSLPTSIKAYLKKEIKEKVGLLLFEEKYELFLKEAPWQHFEELMMLSYLDKLYEKTYSEGVVYYCSFCKAEILTDSKLIKFSQEKAMIKTQFVAAHVVDSLTKELNIREKIFNSSWTRDPTALNERHFQEYFRFSSTEITPFSKYPTIKLKKSSSAPLSRLGTIKEDTAFDNSQLSETRRSSPETRRPLKNVFHMKAMAWKAN